MKPTLQETEEWESRLAAEGLGDPDTPWDVSEIRDTDGIRLPAQPVRNGGIFWRERTYINHARQDRKKVEETKARCASCDSEFSARKGAKFCSRRCQQRELMRSRRVSAKLPILTEESRP